MTLRSITKQKGPLERALSNVETLANNLYYSLTLNKYILKLEAMPLPISLTIDDLIENDFVIGNLVAADAIIQKAHRVSA